MAVPKGFELDFGVYAVWVTLDGLRFRGALHWGPIPTFEEEQTSLEVFLLGLEEQDLSQADTTHIEVDIVERIRDVMKFSSIPELTTQMELDVQTARKVLHE